MESRRNLRVFRDKFWNSETFKHSNWSDWLEVSMMSDMTVFPTPKMALNWACEILETALPCFTIYVIQFSNTKFHACHISWFFMIFDWRDFLQFSRLLAFSKNHFLDRFEIFRKIKWFSRCQKLHSKVAIDYFGLVNCGFLWLTIHNRPKPDLPTWNEHIATLWLHPNGDSDYIQHKTDL